MTSPSQSPPHPGSPLAETPLSPLPRLLVPLAIAAFFVFDPRVRSVITTTVADAYINVGVFVAGTLLVHHIVSKRFGLDVAQLANRPAWQQVAAASLLGALPGCGGAIIVVANFSAGHLGFAALVAVLVSTMGDAAFLLLASSPATALMVISVGVVCGCVSGFIVHLIHSPDFLRQESSAKPNTPLCAVTPPVPAPPAWAWMALFVAAIPFTLMSAFQVDSPTVQVFGRDLDTAVAIGATAGVLCLGMWALLPLSSALYRNLFAEDRVAASPSPHATQPGAGLMLATRSVGAARNRRLPLAASPGPVVRRVIHDTNFIMAWVVAAFLAFELAVYYTGVELGGLFTGVLWLAPLLGVVVGLLPGCGPQIIIATLYLQGAAPMSTLLGNALSNDGDALFPAFALAPKAALVATLYSSVPALVVAYSTYALFEV